MREVDYRVHRCSECGNILKAYLWEKGICAHCSLKIRKRGKK